MIARHEVTLLQPGPPGASAAPRIRVLAVDDSTTIREMLSLLIEAQPDMELVGTAASGHEAPGLR